MSTTQNKGNQQLTFDYKLPAKGRDFNKLLFSVIKPGIYQGLDISIDVGNKINISSGFAFLNCVFESELVRGSLARFQTAIVSESISQSTPGQNEVVYLLFEYKEVVENWVGVYHAQSGSALPSGALTLCDLVYDIDGNITNVLYSNRSYGSLNQDYNIPDTNRFANSLDRTRQGGFDLSRVSGGQTRSIRFPDYDFDLSTLDDWVTSRNYNLKEVVVYNKTLYRCITAHTSSSFFTDLSNWENITEIQDEEKTRGFNDSGSTIANGLVVTISGDSPSEEIPEISPISLYSQEPYGIAISSILNGESGEVIQRGRLVVTSFDSSLGIIGQKVYSDSSGNLTLSITPLVVGQLITPSVSDSVIYVGILPTEEGINPINFNGQLSPTEDTIQKVLDRLDDYGYAPDWETSKNYRVGNLVVRIDDSSNSLWQCVSGHTSNLFSVDVLNWKPIKVDSTGDITSLDSNLSVTGGIGSTLKNVEIQLNQNPELNSINVNEINLTGYNLISSSGVSGLSNNIDVSNIGVLKFDQPTIITGFQKPGINKFKLLTVTNISSGAVILADESSNSDLENRIITGLSKDLTLKPDSSINLYYDFSSLIWRIVGGTGSGGGGSNFDISQTNTFSKGQPIYYDTTTSEWKLAKVDDIAKEAKAVVTESGSPDFIATLSGLIEFESAEITAIIGSSAFVPGTTYYVSDSVAGTYTDLSPAISNPMLFAISTTTALVKPGFNALTSGVGESIVEQPFTSILNQTTFTLDFEPLGKAYTWVSLDGIGEFSDFTISGKDIVFTTPLSAGIEVHVRYIKSFKIDTRNNIISITPITATVGQTIVNLPVVPQSSNYVLLWVDGARQYNSYSLVGNVLTFGSPLAGGEIIEGIIINAVNFDVGVDNYITRKTATLTNTAETTIQTIFGENLSGEYRIKVVGTTSGGNMLFSTTDGLEGTLLGNTSGVYGTSSKLNIDFNSGTIRIQNLTGATIQLSIVREL